ncbi:hypothetical protein HYE67_005904 [Fusarium culmorum]|uniref:Agglutinin-like protein 2 n=1 Tax=Fusarium culmorum TaxID=5516 RepID=A0A7S8D7Z1_FUSCU|nr:hypothetical protein HYE67_005904 [Fusarium culmorum]
MWLSQGLLASTFILAVKAQDGIEDAAMRIATGFAETLIQHAVKTLSGDAGGAGNNGDAVNAGDQGNQGNQGQAFDATMIDAATITHTVGGEAIIETYTRPGGQLFPVTLLPHPRITIAPTTDDPYERIIQAYTGGEDATTNQEITIAEPTGTKPGTVIVDVPGSAYSSFSSGQAGALTIPPSNDHPTATIISALPSGVSITGEATRTIPAAGGASATVVIQTPWEDVPPSTPGAGADGGGAGGTGGNVGGSTSNVLVIQIYTGTEYITQARVTTIIGSGGDQGTVVVQVPPGNQNPRGAVTIPPSGDSHFTTIVRQYTGDTPISTPVTRLIPTSGTQDGTIIIETPGPSSPIGSSGNQGSDSPENQPQVIPPSGDSPYSTILRLHAGSGEITEPVTYTIPPSGTNPGTVIIETPAVRAVQSVITLPSDPGSGYITIVRQPTGTGVITAATTITVPPSNGQPGTIIIETPAQPGGGEITIPAGADGSFITIIRGPTGTNAVNTPTTITVSGAPGQPGTVIIETPVGSGGQTTRAPDDPFTIPPGPGGQYVTIFRPHSGEPITVPITLTQPGQNGQPGTVIIETPVPTTPAPGSGPITIPAGDGGSYVTVYRPHSGSPISQPVTITIQPSGGQPGTIIVETPFNTPKGQNAVTSNEPGGQQITIPPSKNNPYVTIYRPYTGDPITVPITITQSPSNGQPGTIIIETPAPEPQTVTEVETEPGATVTVQPTTPGGYTTVYRPHTGDPISEPITVTTISGSNGQPGTVIIETQGPFTITATESDGTATIYTPGTGVSTTVTKTVVLTASGGQSTTAVIIETPPVKVQPTQSQVTGSNGFVTVTEQYSGTRVITAIFTTTVIASGTGPGTVFIETPPPIKFNPTTSVPESTVTGNDNYVTVYKPYPGPGIITAPITVTEATPSGGQPGTVVVQTPVSQNPTTSLPEPSTTQGPDGYVTVYLPFPGPGVISQSYTRTQAPSGGNPGTVFITTPAPQPATTTSLPESSTTTGSDGYVTVFLPFPGPGVITQSYTRTQAPSGGNPGTVFITTPAPLPQTTAQENLPRPGSITADITSTQPPANGQPGTVYITTPAPISTADQNTPSTSAVDDRYVTVFLPFPGPGTITAPSTSTQPPSGGNPGTVFITTPAPVTSQQGVPSTAQGDGGYVTVFLPYTGTGVITAPITSTQPPSGGNPGTVFITTPASGSETQSQTSALTTDNYITIHTPFPGPGVITSPITITKPPADGQPGTVIIQTPAPISSNADSYVTVYRPYPGPGTITAPITLTQAPANGQPGTVFIETQPTNEPTSSPTSGDSASPITIPPAPTGSYVTIYRPYPGPGQISSAVTYTQAPVSGQSGTVIIETPNSDAPTATQTGPVTVPTGSNNPYVTVYRLYPGPGNIDQPITITSVTASGDQSGTIVIETPTIDVNTKFAPSPTTSPPVTIPADDNNYVTVYRPHTGSPITAPITVTTIAPTGGQPGTVIIETPGPESQPSSTDGPPVTIPQGQDGYVTVYQPYPGPGTIAEPVTVSTIAPTNGQPGTVVIQTPAPVASTSSTSEETSSASAVTIPADNGGYVTVYRPFPGPGTITAPRTVGTVAPTSGRPGTVIIETPAPQATNDESSSAPAVSSTQGTNGYVTVFQPYTGTGVIGGPITVSTIPPSNGQPGTYIVETPVAQTAGSTTASGDNAPVTIPPSPENTYLTVYRPHTGANLIMAPVTVTTIQGENGQPGTIIIETPASQAPTSTEDSRGAPVTIAPGPENSYVIVYRPHTGIDSITAPVTVTTIEGVNGQPGTIIIETPEAASQTPVSTGVGTGATSTVPPGPGSSYVTVYRPYTGTETITAPITSTIQGTNGQPGTVIIETPTSSTPDNNAPSTAPPGPNSSYVTVYRPYTGTESITAPITSTIQGTNGQPGTVIIETLTTAGSDANAPSTAPAGPGSTYITVYEPYPGPGKIDQPITVTTVEPSNGNPGTVIIQTPGIETGGKVVVPPVTVDPSPGEQYTTIYRPHTGTDVITAPVTITTIAPAGGQPGTVIIETPEPETDGPNPTVTLTPGPNESYVTVFQPHTGTDVITGPVVITTIAPANGQPGTVIIETPVAPESTSAPVPADSATSVPQATPTYVTVYRPHTGPERITAPITITTINPSGDQPGTVIIETPDQDLPPVTTSAGPAASYVTVYQPHTGTDRITAPVTITTIEPANGQPGTVIIETPGQQALLVTSTPAPASYVTISRLYTGTDQITEPITTTVPPQGDQPGRVIVETPGQKALETSASSPPSYVTITRPYTGIDQITAPIVTTVPPEGGQPGTVIYETQAPFVTVFRPYTGTDQITGPVTVSTIAPNGGQPGTIIVETPGAGPAVTTTPPAPSYVTVTNLYTGTEMLTGPTTVTTVPPQGDQPGTVIVETQGSYVTISTLYTGASTITGPVPLTTIPPQDNQPGTVVIGTLGSYVTITTQYTGTDPISGPRTVTTIPPQGDQPGTVVVETPQSYITTTVSYTGVDQITAPIAATTIPPSGGQPGRVVIQTQAPFTTVYRPHTGPDRITAPVTVSTIAPNGDQPGTIIVETPGSEPPITTTPPAPSYNTVYEEYTGTNDMTEASARTTIQPQGDQPVTITTIEPQGDKPGTVIVETPGSGEPVTSAPGRYTTIYEPHTGTGEFTGEVTRTIASPEGDRPGTVVIETSSGPGSASDRYTTVYEPHTGTGEFTGEVTRTIASPQGDQPGTVVIETPRSGASATETYTTVYEPHTGPGPFTGEVTRTVATPHDGQPGTVVIETSAGPGSDINRYTTIYEPHTGTGEVTGEVTRTIVSPHDGQPGTVVIETPGPQTANKGANPPMTIPAGDDSYVTVFRPYTGTPQITAPTTVTTIAPTNGQPGTVIIETPVPETSTSSDMGNPPVTLSAGDDKYVTVFRPHTGTDVITAPVTVTTISPSGGQPGTVIIETPEPVTEAVTTTSGPEDVFVTIYRPYTGTEQITAPVTVTTIAPVSGTGTVIIETLAPQTASTVYVTIYRPYTGTARITEPTTVTTIAPVSGTGTVIVETPTPESTVNSEPATSAAITIPSNDESRNVTIIRPYPGPGSVTAPVTRYEAPTASGEPGTVIIETPPVRSPETTSDSAVTIPAHSGSPNVTVIRGGLGKEATTIYVPPTGTEPGTIIIETPTDAAATQEDKTSADQMTSETPAVTLPPSSNSPNVTVIRPYPGPDSITEPVIRYVPPTASGEPGTVIIETQSSDSSAPTSANPEITLPPSSQSPNVTVIRPYPGPGSITEPVTRYVPPTASGEPGTIIIETQTTKTPTELSETSSETQATSSPSGITIPAHSGNPNVTVFRPYTGPGTIETPITSYIEPANSGEPGTVVIETPVSRSESSPQSEAASTSGPVSNPAVLTTDGNTTPFSSASSNPDALTITPSDTREDVTVIEPNTKFAGATENVTQIIPPSGTAPGTKIIYTPLNTPGQSSMGAADTDSYVTISATVTIPGDPSTRTGVDSNAGSDAGTTGAETNVIIILPSGTEPGTVVSQTSVYLDQTLAQHGNVTITRAAPAGVTTPFTTYMPPEQSSDMGTIIVEIPDYNVTTTRAGPARVTTTLTTYSPPASPGGPGMVIIETPDYNVTVTRQAPASVTSVRTTYAPPGTLGDPGTVIVETPNNDYNVTITRGASITAPFTTYSPPGSSGDPGTVIVETPDYNVTVTTQAPSSITSVRTKYVPPGSAGDPGTVVVETPNNDYNVTVTRAAPASVTKMYTTYAPPGAPGDPGTVFVETPDYNVTVTRGASITAPYTTYSPPATPGDPGTVIIETPIGPYNVTTTRGASITAPFTTYSPPGSPGDPGTIIVETPDYNVTITRQGPKTATAVFSTYSPPGMPGDPGTVIVETPAAAYNVTTTRGASTITTPFTTYLSPSEAGDPGTVLIETPDYNVTITRQAPKSVTSLVSIYSPLGSPGDPGTVIIETLMGPYNITTTQGASSVIAPITTYMPPGQPGDPGTVLVETPEYNVTITSEATDSTSDTITRYNPPASPGDPGTVAIIMPNQKAASTSPDPSLTDAPGQNVTVYRPGPRTLTGPITSYIPPSSRGENGTVIVKTPGPATPFNITTTQTVNTITAIYTTYMPAGAQDDPGTILVKVPPSRNVTITKDDATITAPYTTYSPPGTAGDPGTVIIGMPADRNMSITSIVNSRTAPYTTYMPPGNHGDPGTVLIKLPPDSNVTITKTVSDRTAVYTTYSGPTNRSDPGTVIIEVPPGRNVTVTEVASTITSPYTSYSSPANQGDPGTVFIGMPPDSNVTITTEVATRTTPYTTYSSPARQGDPGTVIVEMPPDRNVTITTEIPTHTQPFTTYMSPATKGDPGTIIVEMPPNRNVTITTEATSLTAPYTSYASPGSEGDPGTVIIGMPPDRNVTITTEVPTRTAPYTTYSAPGARGDPGTVIIELPPDRNVTITSEVTGRTAPYTTFAPPATKGYPGTVIVELPPDRNVTTTEEVPTLTQAYTTYSPPGSLGDPGTVIVRLPPDRNVTRTTVVDTITAASTVYSAPANRGNPGTIIIEMPPARNVTTTEVVNSITRATTTYMPPAQQGEPGTVIVQEPPETNTTIVEVVSTITRPATRYMTPGTKGDPGTVYIDVPPNHNVTITTTVSTITRQSTTFAAGATQGDPGTVIVEMPPEYNVTTTQTVQTISRPVTRYSKPGEVGDPGTIYVDLPPEYNVTVITTVSTITRQSTTFAPAAQRGDPGIIIIEMPLDTNTTTTQTIQTITRPVTRYSKPGEVGDPGTVYVDLPPEYNVTITTTVPTIMRPSTTFVPASTQGDAGTILIQMPPETNVTTTQTVSTISRPVTRYSTPGTAGDPGTIYVDLPPEYNVTRTTTVATITRASTTFAPADMQGDPGTVIVQLPPAYNVTVSSVDPTITRPATRFATPATEGDPGTVYIDHPPEYNVTTTETVSTISRVTTKFNPASEEGDPGTILVQVPPEYKNTATQTISTITAIYTTYNPADTQGDPGTILVKAPSDYNVTTTETVSTISQVRTSYKPAGTQGDPNTVLIQVPVDHNVTTTDAAMTTMSTSIGDNAGTSFEPPGGKFVSSSGVSGPSASVSSGSQPSAPSASSAGLPSAAPSSAPSSGPSSGPASATLSSAPAVATSTSRVSSVSMTATDPGSPDTVVVQYPTPYNVTITTAGPTTLTTTSTTYLPPAKSGDPGTVIVQRPPVTVTTTASSAYTTYNPPGASGDAGTVVIATTTRPVAPAYTSAGPQFSCDVYGYLIQKTALYRVEIVSGKTTLIKSVVGDGGWINGIGYNRFDDYIYGMHQDDSGSQLIRIGGDGTSTMLSARTNDRLVNMGDIDNQGRFWISNNGGPWWVIDLMPGSSTYGKIIMSGTASTSGLKSADWAFVPGGGDYMWSVMYNSDGSTSTLCRFSRTSYTWQTMKTFGDVAGNNVWGALYASGDGMLYGSENTSGQIFQFPIAPSIGNPKFIATGPVSSWNDGARCIDSQNLKT